MYKSIKQLAVMFALSVRTVERRTKEMQELDRYPKTAIIEDLGFVRVDSRAFADYLMNRKRLKAGVKVEPYNAKEIQKQLAM